MRTVLNRLGSIKLTLTILLLTAGASAFGTFLPQGGDMEVWEKLVGTTGTRMAVTLGLTDFYHSVWFTALLAILSANLLACMVNRVPGMLSSLSGKAAMGREAVLDLPDSDESEIRTVTALHSLGFRSRRKSGGRIFSRGGWSYLFTLMTHGSILIIMAFSIFGSAAGFVATQRVFVGDSISTAFNWKVGGDKPLPFELRADDFNLQPNPVGVRLGVLELATQKKGMVIVTHEGGTFKVPGVRGRMRLENFDTDRKDFLATWTHADGSRTEIRRDQEIGNSGFSLVPVSYATWPERQVLARVTLSYRNASDRSGEISINHPMVSDGIRIYLTDYGQDKFGLSYVGFQFVKDPGQAGVWAGCVLFLICVTGAFFVRHSCAVVVREGGHLRVHVSSRENRDEIVKHLQDNVIVQGENLRKA
ncbi:MAG: cytochrome c biogenesis protein ResB [bacterium]|nr:cytochrome c biogenesis protein ResB [bacterium]MDT8367088.1 cytochrome c biogenesis protein ResB [bacterium]